MYLVQIKTCINHTIKSVFMITLTVTSRLLQCKFIHLDDSDTDDLLRLDLYHLVLNITFQTFLLYFIIYQLSHGLMVYYILLHLTI